MLDLDDLGNEARELAGAWVDYDDRGTAFKLAAAGNREFEKRAAQLSKDLPRIRPSEMIVDLFWRAAFGTIVLDWRGVTSQGQPVPFTEESFLAVARLKTLAADNIREFIQRESRVAANFAAEHEAAAQAALKSDAAVDAAVG